MHSAVVPEIDAGHRALDETARGFEDRAVPGDRREHRAVVRRITVEVEELDSFPRGEGRGDLGYRLLRSAFTYVWNQLDRRKHYHSPFDGSIFYLEIVRPGLRPADVNLGFDERRTSHQTRSTFVRRTPTLLRGPSSCCNRARISSPAGSTMRRFTSGRESCFWTAAILKPGSASTRRKKP